MLLKLNKTGKDKNKITVKNNVINVKIIVEELFFFLFLIKFIMAYTIKI
tara:strand:- start:417 stop:563 length:147 start_codon:yes stop_codon:yes gene_type:complete